MYVLCPVLGSCGWETTRVISQRNPAAATFRIPVRADQHITPCGMPDWLMIGHDADQTQDSGANLRRNRLLCALISYSS